MSKVKDNELDWYKFFNDPKHGIEYHWQNVYNNNLEIIDHRIIVFLSLWDVERFNEEIGHLYDSFSDEGGIDCMWQDNYIAVKDFIPICEYYDIDPERVFPDKSDLD
jgi:hypothetical protein